MSHEHYFIDVSAYDRVDVYRLIELAGITCPVAQHVFKKAFATGKRGHKDLRRDWQDIADSAARRLQMISEDEATLGQQNTIDCRTDEKKQRPDIKTFFVSQSVHDPRTVEGVDVSFETEKHMNFAPEQEGSVWAEWEGGPMPVLGSVLVDVRQRNGDEFLDVEAEECCWGHSETGDEGGDIVAYRLSAEASHS